MPDSQEKQTYREEARALGKVGAALAQVELPRVEVRLPRFLAERAVAAWERVDEGPLSPETYEERVQRHRAGSLALIGSSISEHGRLEGNEIVVDLDSALIAMAIDAADDLP